MEKQDIVRLLVAKIRQKKPLDQIDEPLIVPLVAAYDISVLRPYTQEQIFRSRLSKRIIKEVRFELNRIYGLFWSEDLTLLGHLSSKERQKLYSRLYSQLFTFTGKPSRLLDLGCGLNPLSYSSLGCQPFYIAVEYTSFACRAVRDFFAQHSIPGEVLQRDLRKLPELPAADVCFCFKLFDVLEKSGHKFAEALLEKIPCPWVIVSFATVTAHKHPMRHPYRGWLQRLCDRKGYDLVAILPFANEVFYILKTQIRHARP